MEVATKLQARILTWSVIALNIAFVGLAVALFAIHNQDSVLASEVRNMYWGRLVIAAVCLGALLFTAAWFFFAFRRSQKEGRVWSKRQHYFGWTAGGLMFLQTSYAAVVLATLITTVAQPNCQYPWIALQVFQFFQWTCLSASILFLLARMKNMVLWRGPGALDMHPDYRLLVDRPFADQAKAYWLITSIWLVLEGATMAGMILKLNKIRRTTIRTITCDTDLMMMSCPATPTQIAATAISFVVIMVFGISWVITSRRALKDHEQLPFIHYRSTHIYIRVQARVLTPVFTAVVMSLLFMSVIPTFDSNCVSSADAQVGNVATDMSMTVAAIVMAVMFMPKAQAFDSPLLQEFLQDFAWTEEGMPAAIEARNQRMRDSELATDQAASAPQTTEGFITNLLTFLPGAAMMGMAKMAGVQDMESAAKQLSEEPIFCMETACRLFYWTRLAYRKEDDLDYEFINVDAAKRLFNLDQHAMVWDDETDTHVVLGWSDSQVVLAFRGTASLQNAMTDIKAWKMVLPPHRRVRGSVVKVHAGFGNAWLNNNFNKKVLEKLQEIDQAQQGTEPLRFWITGHSLGGALAVLASEEVAKAFPDSKITCYTWGAPRVGNGAFTHEQEQAVPDTWAILNGGDPIPWIPKGGFKRGGKRVTVNAKGDLVLRPTYFETSVMQRGTNASHHKTGGYALSLAAIFKAQFVSSKAFPGGAEGVRRLAAALDLGSTLILKHMDIKSLEDPAVLPVSVEVVSKKNLNSSKSLMDECGGGCTSLWPFGKAAAAFEDGEGGGEIEEDGGATDPGQERQQ